MKLLKKLGAKQILGNVGKVIQDSEMAVGDQKAMYTIYGVCNGTKSGVSTYGEWTAFLGKMAATNFITGEAYSAPQCFIPAPLDVYVLDGLADSESVEFAFVVNILRLEDDPSTGAINYEYIVEPRKEVQESDPLAHLASLVQLEPPKPTKEELAEEKAKNLEKNEALKKAEKKDKKDKKK